jgi:hypothetical protein
MNGFSEWRSGSALQQALTGNVNETRTANFGSLEDMLKKTLGDQFGKKEESINENELAAAQARAKELAEAANKIQELTSKVQQKIEETQKEEEPLTEEPVKEVYEEIEPQSKAYRVFRDRDENFECKITIQGAGLSAAQVRIVLDCDLWNFTFYGKLYKDGRCVVPFKKGIPLPEGTRGRARLEVVIDEQLFLPWEDDFIVEGSKKVQVELKEQKSVKVSFKHSSEE